MCVQVSEDVEEVVARLTGIAHATLDDNPHCSGFQVVQLGRETDDPDALLNQDGAAGNPAFYQVRSVCVLPLLALVTLAWLCQLRALEL